MHESRTLGSVRGNGHSYRDISGRRYPFILTIDQYVTHAAGREKLFNCFTEYAGECSVVYVGYSFSSNQC